jgi:hypothetical protein
MTGKNRSWKIIALAGALSLVAALPAGAFVSSDRPSAILIYPTIQVDDDPVVDTVIQISNTSDALQVLQCFYVNATSHCSATGAPCDLTNPCGASGGFCQPGWIETDFFIYITPRQPIAWRASIGLADGLIPLDGTFFVGPQGFSNEGTRIPPVGEIPYVGELKCVVIDDNGRPVPNNAIKGEATITTVRPDDDIDVLKYNAVGFQAFEADVNEDRVLVLGGGTNEYDGCAQTLVVDHFFDFATNPVSGDTIDSSLILVPCTQDLLNQIPGSTTAQYLIFNEFEQRFSTSQPVDCYFERPLSLIETTNRSRSVFSVFVAGTVTGQTRVRGVHQGLVGVLITRSGTDSAARNLHMQGDREQSDFITLP